jgi:hypothetical protein
MRVKYVHICAYAKHDCKFQSNHASSMYVHIGAYAKHDCKFQSIFMASMYICAYWCIRKVWLQVSSFGKYRIIVRLRWEVCQHFGAFKIQKSRLLFEPTKLGSEKNGFFFLKSLSHLFWTCVRLFLRADIFFWNQTFAKPSNRVARWHIFKPKTIIWVNFRGIFNQRCWYILLLFGIFYGHLVYFVAIWFIIWLFGIFFPFWYAVPRKIWQPCRRSIFAKWFEGFITTFITQPGLPDFSWSKIPKRGKIYQITTKYTKCT